MSQSGWVGEHELELSTIQRSLGYARVHTRTLRHGEVHDYSSIIGAFHGPGHHGIGAGPVEGVCRERS